MKSRFKRDLFASVSKQELFAFHERDDAFSLLTPASANIEVESTASTLAPSDDVVRFAVKFGPLRFWFENVHTVYQPFDLFVDEQRKGLFSIWRHEHRFREGAWEGAQPRCSPTRSSTRTRCCRSSTCSSDTGWASSSSTDTT